MFMIWERNHFPVGAPLISWTTTAFNSPSLNEFPKYNSKIVIYFCFMRSLLLRRSFPPIRRGTVQMRLASGAKQHQEEQFNEPGGYLFNRKVASRAQLTHF